MPLTKDIILSFLQKNWLAILLALGVLVLVIDIYTGLKNHHTKTEDTTEYLALLKKYDDQVASLRVAQSAVDSVIALNQRLFTESSRKDSALKVYQLLIEKNVSKNEHEYEKINSRIDHLDKDSLRLFFSNR